ncbi:MAG TPA: Xaa-Pro peptidase family protein [Bryobacteraceae bacterium]|nr:Xaa-Pro peptidase family protein [Bryobacteraceae bacterium]
MLTRRRMLASAALAPLAIAQRREGAMPSLPADSPILKLKSRRAESTPISVEERRARIARAQELMHQNKIDAICLAGGTSLDYFGAIRWGGSERLFAMVIPAKGDSFFVSPAFEEDRAREQIALGPGGKDPRVLVWHEDQSPYERVAAGLKERSISTGTVGIEETVKFVFSDGIGKALPAMKVASATAVTAGCRMVKTAHELALMRLASQVTFEAYEAAWKSLKAGMTQNEFAGLVSAAHSRLGFPGGAGVQVGENSALPHGSATPQVVREGTILLIDGGCAVEGFQSDISRTFVLGKPTDKMKKVFDIVYNAQSAALKAARPGVACEDVDEAARKVIAAAGYGSNYEQFTHRVGHGMGMDGHEWPYLVRGNKLKLAPGMVFSDEPGVYLRGEFGVRLEDDMHITENGAELFTPQSASLEDPFGRR